MVKYEKVEGGKWTDEMKNYMKKLRETSRKKIYREMNKKLIIWNIYKHAFVYKEDDTEVQGLQLQKKHRPEEDSDDNEMDNELDKSDNDENEPEFNEAELEENLDKIEEEKISDESDEEP